MKHIFTLSFLLFTGYILSAQDLSSQQYSSRVNSSNKNKKTINFNGQWKGGFDETSYNFAGLGGNNITYVLELTTEGSRVSGYSYTYFTEGAKRYYTICRLTGSLNRATNELVVTEVERTKFNTPPDFHNCFQTHRLHYEKGDDNTEFLRGTWIPAPNQGEGCGNGTTLLSRRIVNRLPLGIKPSDSNKNTVKAPVKKAAPKNPALLTPKKPVPPVVKKATPQKPKIEKSETVINDMPIEEKREINSKTLIDKSPKLENRKKNVVKTIVIEQPTFRVDFYDNGEIDGDSITVFYNGRAVLSNKRLSDKPISLTLTLDKNAAENEVVMYAENLGTIPPNTALMIVTDGSRRYEVRMESDLGKSGSVIFKHE